MNIVATFINVHVREHILAKHILVHVATNIRVIVTVYNALQKD